MNFIIGIETLILLIGVVVYIKSVKKSHYNLAEIDNLRKEINKVNLHKRTVNLQRNRRKYHRILLKNITCTLKVIDFGNHSLQRLNNKQIDGQIVDLSAGGLGFLCDVDFPVNNSVIVEISFSLNGNEFKYSGVIVRKEAHEGSKDLVYGIQFTNLGSNDEARLNFLVNNLEISKKKIN